MRFRIFFIALAALLLSSAASAAVRVQLAHLAPLSSNAEATALTVRINGTALTPSLRYGDIRTIELGGTGTYNFDVSFANSNTVLVGGAVSANDGEQFTMIIVGNNVTQPLGLYFAADSATTPPSGSAFVRFLHVAPYAAGNIPVTVRTQAGTAVNGLESLPYAGTSPYISFVAANYDLRVTTLDSATTIIDPPPLTFVSGTVRQYAIAGDGVRQPFQLVPLVANATGSVVDYSAQGAWTTGNAPGQGITLYPIPNERRLTGAWYTFTPTGQQQWFTLDTCGTPTGATGCTNPAAFNNRTATMTVYQTTGGTFLGPTPTETRVAGTITITFQSCTQANATYSVDGRTGSFAMTNLLPVPNCTITP